MRNDYSERSERLVGYWWLSLIAGVILIAIGFFVIVHPAASYLSFAVWFGVAVMFSGILTLVQSLSSNNRYVRSGWLILASIADIIIGIILVFNAVVSAFVMPVLLGAWLLYRGTAMLMQGIDLKSHSVRGSGWLIFYSAIVIVVGLAVLWMPATLGVEAVILFVAIAFVSYGVSMVTLAFRLLDVHRYAKRLGAEE
jgi:uncharacterized membrane protein HdeD (DUF308 family)